MTTITEDLQEFQKLMFFRENSLVTSMLDHTGMFELATRSKLYIQMMASAFLEETKIPAHECELVVKHSDFGTVTTFSFRRREEFCSTSENKKATLTLSFDKCPACGKPHHLPLVFLEQTDGTYRGQCTNNLQVVKARLNEAGRLEVEK